MCSRSMTKVVARDGHRLMVQTYWSGGNPDEATHQIFHVHGGGFSSGTDVYGENMCVLLSKAKPGESIVYGLNFRKNRGADKALEDIIDVVNHFKTKGCTVYLSGGSSGGWFAMMAACNRCEEVEVDGVMVFCPVLYPVERARWLTACAARIGHAALPGNLYTVDDEVSCASPKKATKVLGLQNDFFGDTTPEKICFPAPCETLLVASGQDANVPPYLQVRAMPHMTTTVMYGNLNHQLQEAKNLSGEDEMAIRQQVVGFMERCARTRWLLETNSGV